MKNISSLIIVLLSLSLLAQTNSQVQINEFKQAKQLIKEQKYEQALKHLKTLETYNPENANYIYLIGKCYLNIPNFQTKAIPYLTRANKKISENYNSNIYNFEFAPIETTFLLAQAYYYDYKFNKSLELITNITESSTNEKDKKNLADFKKKCTNAIEISENPIKAISSELNKNVNSIFSETNPLINTENTLLIFTSDQENVGVNQVYCSKKVDGSWSKAEKLNNLVNGFGSITAVSISSDGNQLILVKNDNGNKDLYISHFNGDWSSIEKLSENINTKYSETSASFSPNGDQIFFVSDKPNGIGGKDIYVSKILPNGKWGKSVNLGPKINTPENEDGVLLHSDGYTLFFSSQGRNSLGGYDLFYSDFVSDTAWSEPFNMGYPLNTVYDETNFSISTDGKRVFFAKNSCDSISNTNIFSMILLSAPNRNAVVVKGYLRNKKGEIVFGEAVKLSERNSNKFLGLYSPNLQGQYTFILREGLKYFISLNDETIINVPKMFEVPTSSSFYEIGKPVIIDPITVVQ